MSKAARKRERSWRSGHHTKRVYASRMRARLAILSLWLDNRRPDLRLQAYECRWGTSWQHGRSYPLHWHIGHAAPRYWRRRWKRRLHRILIYPARRSIIW